MVHVGVDLDKHTSQIAVLAGDGEIAQQRVPNDAARLAKFFAELPPQTPVAIEASGTWWWLVDLLEELGHQPVLSNPKQTKAIAAARLKNDRVDAERLALLLRGDLLPTVWIPPAALREARELVRHRIQLVWLRGVIRNRLQAMLARRNLQPTSGKSWLTQRAARAARVAAAALDGGAESDPRGLCGTAAHLGRPDPVAGYRAHHALGAGSPRAAPDHRPRHWPLQDIAELEHAVGGAPSTRRPFTDMLMGRGPSIMSPGCLPHTIRYRFRISSFARSSSTVP